jgi:hypothetical protein
MFPELAGADTPPDCRLSIQEAFTQFCKDMANTEIPDKRGQIIRIEEYNFPKFLGMKRIDPKTGKFLLNQNGFPIKAKAKVVIAALKAETLDPESYFIEYPRLRTLFWIPDVLRQHDAIHPNTSKKIEGDEVYFRKYNLQGACLKLVFTEKAGAKRVVVTSFSIEERDLKNYVNLTPIWPPKSK